MIIGIIGANTVNDEVAKTAYLVGKLVAERGGIVLCGGLGGVMEAACKGAVEAGGMTVGILPGTDKAAANPCVKIPIPTGIGYARNAIIAQACDACIAIGGAHGTLSEIAMALNNGKKVVSLGSWDLEKAGPVDATRFIQTTTPQDAVEHALADLS